MAFGVTWLFGIALLIYQFSRIAASSLAVIHLETTWAFPSAAEKYVAVTASSMMLLGAIACGVCYVRALPPSSAGAGRFGRWVMGAHTTILLSVYLAGLIAVRSRPEGFLAQYLEGMNMDTLFGLIYILAYALVCRSIGGRRSLGRLGSVDK